MAHSPVTVSVRLDSEHGWVYTRRVGRTVTHMYSASEPMHPQLVEVLKDDPQEFESLVEGGRDPTGAGDLGAA